jgi:three-Cys-motif partner protein
LNAPARIAEPRTIDHDPATWPGANADEMRIGPDGLPVRVVKLHNAHKAHFIARYAHAVAVAMKRKWHCRAFIDLFSGPGLCWVKGTGEFVDGSPLIAFAAEPQFSHHIFVDLDSRSTCALEQRLAGSGATIMCADANDATTIELVHAAIPRRGCLSLALLDPQGCNPHLETIRQLTHDRSMDLLINLPIHGLYRCLTANDWSVLDAVLGPDWRDITPCGVRGWRAAVRARYRKKLDEMGYVHSSAKEVRSETKKSPFVRLHPRKQAPAGEAAV